MTHHTLNEAGKTCSSDTTASALLHPQAETACIPHPTSQTGCCILLSNGLPTQLPRRAKSGNCVLLLPSLTSEKTQPVPAQRGNCQLLSRQVRTQAHEQNGWGLHYSITNLCRTPLLPILLPQPSGLYTALPPRLQTKLKARCVRPQWRCCVTVARDRTLVLSNHQMHL